MNESTERAEAEEADEAEEEEQQQPRVIRVAAATMTGDLLRALVDELRRQSKPWQALTATQQEAIIERFHVGVGKAIVDAVKIIAGDGRAAIVAKLEQAVIKDAGIKATLALSQNDPGRHDLTDAVGKQVLLSVVDVSPYRGGDRPTPDAGPVGQQDLPLAEGAAPGALDALEAGIEAADTPDWTGIAGENTEDDLATIASWSDEQVRAAEDFCLAVEELERGERKLSSLPERPAVLGGPLPTPDAGDEDEAGLEQEADEDATDDEGDGDIAGTDDGDEPL
jgi:hypothetical protein